MMKWWGLYWEVFLQHDKLLGLKSALTETILRFSYKKKFPWTYWNISRINGVTFCGLLSNLKGTEKQNGLVSIHTGWPHLTVSPSLWGAAACKRGLGKLFKGQHTTSKHCAPLSFQHNLAGQGDECVALSKHNPYFWRQHLFCPR